MSKEGLYALKTPYIMNRGLWEDSKSYDPDNPILTGTAQLISQEIRNKLTFKKTVVVEVGSLFAADILAIAANFQTQINKGDLSVIATNLEQFDVNKGIHHTNFWQFISSVEISLFSKLLNTKINPELPDEKLLRLIRNYQHLITFISGVDARKLPKILTKYNLGKADVIIEHYGGIHHSSHKYAALWGIANSLNQNGVIITREDLNRIQNNIVGKFGLKEDLELKNIYHLVYRKI